MANRMSKEMRGRAGTVPDRAVRLIHRRSGDTSGCGSDGPANLLISQTGGLLEYVEEHWPGQLSGLRVLIRGVIGSQKNLAVRQREFCTVREHEPRLAL